MSARATDRGPAASQGTQDIEVRHLMIPTRDGTRLSANLFLPAAERPVPCVVEYTPYRKDDFRGAARDFGSFYFAEQGIAAAQLDVRGTGESDGSVVDEYQHPQEQLDGYDALEWLAAQSWCNGRTGLWGTSYAGFTALQVAQIQPPSLGAIAPIYATDDRYTDDMHFRGGALNGWSVIGSYALGMVTRNALPPYPELAGGEWERLWKQRLERNEPWLIRWIEEQLNGSYWRSTLARMYERVRVPTLIIGGWADYYVNASLRWMQHLTVPKKLIMGPWPHTPPDAATPGPRIDFLWEITRWWKQWLAGEATGIVDEPPVTVFVQAYRRPGPPADVAPGFWRFEHALPPARMREKTWFLGPEGELTTIPAARDHAATLDYLPFVGYADPCVGGGRAEWGEQAGNEQFSLLYTSEPLDEETEILGFPRLTLHASATAKVAFFAARLCDVAPDGASILVTKGILNATRRNGMDRAEPLTPGEVYRLEIELDAISWIFPRGHRIRLAISGADFPDIWPAPYPAQLTVYSGPSHPSRMALPEVPTAASVTTPAGAASAVATPTGVASATPIPSLRPPALRRSRFTHVSTPARTEGTYDAPRGKAIARRELQERLDHPDGATVVTSEHRTEMSVSGTDPAHIVATGWDRRTIVRPDLSVECTAEVSMRSEAAAFALDLTLDVVRDGAPYWRRRWTRTIPRNLL